LTLCTNRKLAQKGSTSLLELTGKECILYIVGIVALFAFGFVMIEEITIS
jgi:hypothetical protein